MLIKSRTRAVRLNKWFPAGDPLAPKIARLCILREDFLLEMEGIFAEQIAALDGSSEEWRRLYFLRALVRTLREIESGMQTLFCDRNFKRILAAQDADVRAKFTDHAKIMNDSLEVVTDVRNDICGHVLERAVAQAIADIANQHDLFALLETAPQMRHSHFKFAGDLIAQILVRGVPEHERHRVLEEKFIKIAELFPAFALIEYALDFYLLDRGILSKVNRGE